ncbi:ABC transporter permease subunit [Halorussus gelatinilyticus]|uniref:ABC transporter permease subunit n=1 Tax=Halorussus gelatinilyticus TaxID=2937524 RepID=A0A8U0IF32_9EURY|nr:ABC transporter permease subunit [Halorussus gelatinilyticus]UPV99676.1 ABC transporter permease subunit [Halorussus gelatinilyticus]
MSYADRVPAATLSLPAGALAVGVLAWWAVVGLLDVPPYLLPSPVAVADRLVARPGLYLRNAAITLETILTGGAVGVLGGFVAAGVVVHSTFLRHALAPYLVTLRVLPKIAVAPLLLVYLGTGAGTATTFVALITFFPTFVSSASGLRETPEEYLDLLRSVDAGPVETFLRVRVPAALPDVFAGLKQSAALAVVGAVVAEWILTDEGLGYLVLVGSENVQTDVVLAAVVVLFAEGMAIYGAVAAAENRLSW